MKATTNEHKRAPQTQAPEIQMIDQRRDCVGERVVGRRPLLAIARLES